MKLIIFAGGSGTRLWPLSLRNSPKQFEKFKDNKSTLQMAFERIKKFGKENIYISTNEKYVDMVKEELPDFIPENILGEPARRDIAAAVGLTLLRLKKQGYSGIVAILWADHFMHRPEEFLKALDGAENLIVENKDRFVFLGEKPRFANQNLGWIQVGKNLKENQYEFLGWKYRPELLDCQMMFEEGNWFWNPGYFVFDIDFVLELYRQHMGEMCLALENMVESEEKIKEEYPKLEAISFDQAIVEKINNNQGVVLKVDMGWSDPGTLYALKESMVEEVDKNYLKGKVVELGSRDSLIYNDDDSKLVTAVGLDGMIVVNTPKSILVCHKDKVPEIKELLKKIEEEGMGEYL